MHARVATFEGGEPDAMRHSAAESNSRASSANSIEGVPATGLLLLIDPDDRRACWVSLYETEDPAYRTTSRRAHSRAHLCLRATLSLLSHPRGS
jgi:hypothetical protein